MSDNLTCAPSDCASGTRFNTLTASDTIIFLNDVTVKSRTTRSVANLIHNMPFVLSAEIPYAGQDRFNSSLPKTAQRGDVDFLA